MNTPDVECDWASTITQWHEAEDAAHAAHAEIAAACLAKGIHPTVEQLNRLDKLRRVADELRFLADLLAMERYGTR